MAKRIRVIVLEPQGRAHIEDVEDSLEDFQRLVGGLIEHHQLTPPCPTGAGLHLFGNEEAIAEDLAPNLWGLVLGGPFLGPLVLFREDRHDHKVNITPADEQYWTGDLKRILDGQDRKSTRLNSSHSQISYAVFCLK